MNRDQKAVAVEEIATQIGDAEAIFAVDYRGISVSQVAELRTKLGDAGARFRVVKNTLTERAADQAGAESLKPMLEGPTAFTFVSAGGDVALAAKALSQFKRANEVLDFKGGLMAGEALTIEQIDALARLPGVEVLRGQMVGVLASPITGLVRGLNQLIGGLAIALGQIQAEGKVGGEAPAEEEPPPPEDGPDAGESDADAPATPEPETEEETTDTPSEGGNEEEG